MGIDEKADNKAEELKGKGKEAIGDATDDKDLQAKGRAQEAKGSLIAARFGNVIVSFQFVAQKTADPSELPDEFAIVNKGLSRLAS